MSTLTNHKVSWVLIGRHVLQSRTIVFSTWRPHFVLWYSYAYTPATPDAALVILCPWTKQIRALFRIEYLSFFLRPLLYKINLDTRDPGSSESICSSLSSDCLLSEPNYFKKVRKNKSLPLICLFVTVNRFWIIRSWVCQRARARLLASDSISCLDVNLC